MKRFDAGKTIGLANKEVLVASGKACDGRRARSTGPHLIPVDSEHNGAHQCLRAGLREEAVKLILTASGGPFRNTPAAQFASVTPGAGFESSNMEDGSADHDRLGDFDE